MYLKWMKQNWKMSTCNRLDLESPGSWPTMPQNFPGTDPQLPQGCQTTLRRCRDSPPRPCITWSMHSPSQSAAAVTDTSVVRSLAFNSSRSIDGVSSIWCKLCQPRGIDRRQGINYICTCRQVKRRLGDAGIQTDLPNSTDSCGLSRPFASIELRGNSARERMQPACLQKLLVQLAAIQQVEL